MAGDRDRSRLTCQAPLTSLEFDPSGAVLACCANALYPLGRVGETPLREIWDGPRAVALRAAVARRDYSLGCTICSHRLRHHGAELPMEGYSVLEGTAVDGWPSRLSFSLHNTCNLECIMCGADRSSRIRTRRAGLAPLPHVYGDAFFAELEEFLPYCRQADFVGGEPFLVREHWRVWDLLWRVRPDVRCSVTTNATVWNERVEQVLERFDTDARVSLDALDAATFEAIRVGSVFDEVMANFDRFLDYSRERGTSLSISFSFVRQNWHELLGMLEWAEELGLRVHVQTVIEREFGVQHLPDDELRRVRREMERQAANRRAHLVLNAAVWDRQLDMLDEELRRRAGDEAFEPCMEAPHPRNAALVQAAVQRWFATSLVEATDDGLPAAVQAHLRAFGIDPDEGLRARLDPDGTVRVMSAESLGSTDVAPTLSTFAGVGELLESWVDDGSDGLWVLEQLPLPGALLHTVAVGGVHRDGSAVLYRVVAWPGHDGAELRVYRDVTTRRAPAPVAVAVRARPGV